MRKDFLTESQREEFYKQLYRPGYSYGLGIRTLIEKGSNQSLSIGEFGWDGAAGAYALMDPDITLSIFYAQHILNCDVAYSIIHPTIRDLTYYSLP